MVTIESRSGAETLAISLGAHSDYLILKPGQVINATDLIDGGDGIDTLHLTNAGSANLGVFSNFENLNVTGVNRTLDLTAFRVR